MLLQRVITAVVLLIIIIGALLISPLAFTAVAAIAIGCCFWEWLRICKWNNGVAVVCGIVLGAFLFFLEYASPAALQTVQSGNGLMIITATATVLWAVITAVIFTRRSTGWMVPKGIGALLGWIFVPAAWFSLMYLFRDKGTITCSLSWPLSGLPISWLISEAAVLEALKWLKESVRRRPGPARSQPSCVSSLFRMSFIGLSLLFLSGRMH